MDEGSKCNDVDVEVCNAVGKAVSTDHITIPNSTDSPTVDLPPHADNQDLTLTLPTINNAPDFNDNYHLHQTAGNEYTEDQVLTVVECMPNSKANLHVHDSSTYTNHSISTTHCDNVCDTRSTGAIEHISATTKCSGMETSQSSLSDNRDTHSLHELIDECNSNMQTEQADIGAVVAKLSDINSVASPLGEDNESSSSPDCTPLMVGDNSEHLSVQYENRNKRNTIQNEEHQLANDCSGGHFHSTTIYRNSNEETLLNVSGRDEDEHSLKSDGDLKEALLTSFSSELALDKEVEINKSALSDRLKMPYTSRDLSAFENVKYVKGNDSYSSSQKWLTSQSKDNGMEHENVPSEVDGPWSIAVAFASFVAQMLMGGYCYSGGLFYTIFRYEFPEVSNIAVSWMCALPLTMWFAGSPAGSIICNRYGPRVCSLLGGFIAFIGLSACFIITNFYVLFVFYGLVAGLGHGMQFVGFITCVNLYCKKHRALVTILTTLGPTFGMSLYSFLVPYLYTMYSWTGTLLILGAIALNMSLCATLLFPIKTQIHSRKLFTISVLKEKYFALFCLCALFGTMTNGMTILHLPSLVLSFGLGSVTASLALMLFGVANSGAKILFAGCGHFMKVEVSTVYLGCTAVCAVFIALLPVNPNKHWVLAFASLVGVAYNVLGGHYIEMVSELVGQERFSNAIGIAQFSKAIGTIISGPFCGVLFQVSGTYALTFYTVAGLLCLVSILLIPIHKHRRQTIRIFAEITIKEPVEVTVKDKLMNDNV